MGNRSPYDNFLLTLQADMRVLIVNTSERTGGAAVAANRLMKALNASGVKAKMLVREKISDDLTVVPVKKSWRTRWNFLWERWCIFCHLHFRRRHLFEIDMANAGTEITRLPEFREADIIHLHWINQGMLSLSGIRRILDSGKPVVWTMHDAWPATAICHYARGCKNFKRACQRCPLLPSGGSKKDLSAKIWQRKQRMLEGHNVSFVACSRWLMGQAKESALLRGQNIVNIPNPIDTHIYHQKDQRKAREALDLPTNGKIILFISQRVTDERKGMKYFIEAMHTLVKNHPDEAKEISIALLGGHTEEISAEFDVPVYQLGYMNDDQNIVDAYNASDVFVLPSLEDNLPNTIMEAMACGVPCVGFKVGGIPEEIDHLKNGYVANYRDSANLAQGIYWAIFETDREVVVHECLTKVNHSYSQSSVALRYIEVYNEVIAQKNYKI